MTDSSKRQAIVINAIVWNINTFQATKGASAGKTFRTVDLLLEGHRNMLSVMIPDGMPETLFPVGKPVTISAKLSWTKDNRLMIAAVSVL